MNITIQRTALAAAFFGLLATLPRAQTSGPVLYRLENTSTYMEGCFPPCLCPIFFVRDLRGTHELQFTYVDPAGYVHYSVTNVDWRYDLGATPHQVTGSGEYKIGGQVLVQEQLILDLSVDGGPSEHFDSGLVVPSAVFPHIDVTVSMNGMFCYDKAYALQTSPANIGLSYCSGDGTGTICPCSNGGATGNGCANSVNAAGAGLVANGKASIGADSVVLVSTGTPNGATLFFQGTQRTNGGAGAVFGDGLLCASGTITRLKVAIPVGGEARVPSAGDPPLSVLGGLTSPGVLDYQVWYRDAGLFCTGATFNLTNGREIAWSP